VIVDSSALISITLGEKTAGAIRIALSIPEPKRISAANMLETWMVIDRRRLPGTIEFLEDSLNALEILVEPVTEEHVFVARDAWRRYGRGSGHPAQLNFGDCFAYALAKVTAEPLLYGGNDFTHTDLLLASIDA